MALGEDTQIGLIALHSVGNKATDDGVYISKELLEVDDKIDKLLTTYFLSPFKSSEYFNLYHDTDLNLNEVYAYVTKIFDDPQNLYEQSVNLAKHLYEQSNHPKIKGGEFYVVLFKDCIVEGHQTDAVGLFKSENKDTFLKVSKQGNGFDIRSEKGVNVNKLDKGCLIFNAAAENGYIVSIVDNTNKSEAQYWIDDFLHVRQRKDTYYNTQNVMSLCKDFATKELPNQFEVSKADQAEFLNKSAKFFKEKDSFDMDEFAAEVINQPAVIDSFNKYKASYEQERDIEIATNFDISDTAVKKQSRIFKSIIKLDKNFHIYVHGNNQHIKRGYDEATGMHYYQLFFEKEL